MMQRPEVLVIAGHDSAGLAGLNRDSQTIQALGAHSKAVVSACTAQNAQGVQSINPTCGEVFTSQLKALLQNNNANSLSAIKIGLLASAEQVTIVHEELSKVLSSKVFSQKTLPLVIDPVLSASSGTELISSGMLARFQDKLLPLCTLITPNLDEASRLCGFTVKTSHDIQAAALMLLEKGVSAVLIKGGHSDNAQLSQDYFCSKQRNFWLSSEKLDSPHTRGSGCTLASAIAASIALNYSLYDAVVIGKMAVNQGLRNAYKLLQQHGPVNSTEFPCKQADLPDLSQNAYTKSNILPFPAATLPSGKEASLGLYPVVDSAAWVERLLKVGVSTIQLRVKDFFNDSEVQSDSTKLVAESSNKKLQVETEIKQAIQVAKQYDGRLFINDHWQLAIKHKAYGVHLGQEDLNEADVSAIHSAGLRLGISTHCHYEVARAHFYRPSYIACGPVFHTNTKQMPWIPHGPKGFGYWRGVLDYPLVAIGGINAERITPLLQQGADAIAMITAITLSPDPEKTTTDFMHIIDEYYRAVKSHQALPLGFS